MITHPNEQAGNIDISINTATGDPYSNLHIYSDGPSFYPQLPTLLNIFDFNKSNTQGDTVNNLGRLRNTPLIN